jgi:glutamate formiminotransferase/formiminotetrahydrofolate cyclodeaminase
MAEVRFSDQSTLSEFLAALASPEDTHGVVAAAAVAAAMGTSLLQMAAASGRGDDQVERASTAAALARIQQELLETVETETAVKLFAACKLPHALSAERVKRENAIQLALRAAMEVPLEVMRLCVGALQHADSVARYGPRAASADVTLAVALFEAALHAARANVEAKLPILTDAGHAASLGEQVARLSEDAAAAAGAARSRLTLPPI